MSITNDNLIPFTVIPYKLKDKYEINRYHPATSAFHNPSYFQKNVVRYVKAFTEYANYQKLKVAEDIAHSFNAVLVPRTLLHSRRKIMFKDKRVQVGKLVYYVIPLNQLTEGEKEKISIYSEEQE
ncbi:hypothetical protein ACFSO7_22375 [Bacillus sp. CGMCC 1.16607]|uniref:hypothetical protein n=1 Tax=Bacillus sp. CGMCC 1.16607 TaxID=3351842 RepID=UPI00362E6DDF